MEYRVNTIMEVKELAKKYGVPKKSSLLLGSKNPYIAISDGTCGVEYGHYMYTSEQDLYSINLDVVPDLPKATLVIDDNGAVIKDEGVEIPLLVTCGVRLDRPKEFATVERIPYKDDLVFFKGFMPKESQLVAYSDHLSCVPDAGQTILVSSKGAYALDKPMSYTKGAVKFLIDHYGLSDVRVHKVKEKVFEDEIECQDYIHIHDNVHTNHGYFEKQEVNRQIDGHKNAKKYKNIGTLNAIRISPVINKDIKEKCMKSSVHAFKLTNEALEFLLGIDIKAKDVEEARTIFTILPNKDLKIEVPNKKIEATFKLNNFPMVQGNIHVNYNLLKPYLKLYKKFGGEIYFYPDRSTLYFKFEKRAELSAMVLGIRKWTREEIEKNIEHKKAIGVE